MINYSTVCPECGHDSFTVQCWDWDDDGCLIVVECEDCGHSRDLSYVAPTRQADTPDTPDNGDNP